MPRPVKRTIGTEDTLARRIRHERERRGMKPAALAAYMTEAGSPMTQSAIWRIEHEPRSRRITLDEAIAFARVFGMDLADLLMPPEVADREEARKLYEEIHRLEEQIGEHRAAVEETSRRLAELIGAAPAETVLEAFAERDAAVARERVRAKGWDTPEGLLGPGPWDDPASRGGDPGETE